MRSLCEKMDPLQYRQLSSGGMFTVRRNTKHWNGNFTDQVIEQNLMRMIKAPGGLAHGRGKNFGELKLKRNDRVVSMAMSHNAVNVRGKEVDINPTLLFLRVTCVIDDNREMSNYLEYEFSRYPPSMFEKGQMRKTARSALFYCLIKGVTPTEVTRVTGARYVIDGGYLLHVVHWPADATFSQIKQVYLAFVGRHWGPNVTIVFDGYVNASQKPKWAEQEQREQRSPCPNVIVEDNSKITIKQQSFLGNIINKSQLISMLINFLRQNDITCYQSQGDADSLICATCNN